MLKSSDPPEKTITPLAENRLPIKGTLNTLAILRNDEARIFAIYENLSWCVCTDSDTFRAQVKSLKVTHSSDFHLFGCMVSLK